MIEVTVEFQFREGGSNGSFDDYHNKMIVDAIPHDRDENNKLVIISKIAEQLREKFEWESIETKFGCVYASKTPKDLSDDDDDEED